MLQSTQLLQLFTTIFIIKLWQFSNFNFQFISSSPLRKFEETFQKEQKFNFPKFIPIKIKKEIEKMGLKKSQAKSVQMSSESRAKIYNYLIKSFEINLKKLLKKKGI